MLSFDAGRRHWRSTGPVVRFVAQFHGAMGPLSGASAAPWIRRSGATPPGDLIGRDGWPGCKEGSRTPPTTPAVFYVLYTGAYDDTSANKVQPRGDQAAR